MTVCRKDFRMAAEVCNTEFDRLYHLMMLLGLKEHAAMVRSVDKGKLIARVVTHGIEGEDFSPGELFVLALVCFREAVAGGVSVDEIRGMLLEVHGQHTARDVLRRMREGARP